MNVESCCRSSNGEWRSCADLGGDGGGENHGERGVGESRVKKFKHDEKESSIETKDKKRKSEGESVSKLKKENEELKEKLRKLYSPCEYFLASVYSSYLQAQKADFPQI